jgi:hypothetical protein
VWRGTTAHTLYVFEWRRPAILYYGEKTLNCGEHYSAASGQSRNVHYSDQSHSGYSCTAQEKFRPDWLLSPLPRLPICELREGAAGAAVL